MAQKSEARWGEEQAAKTQCKGANRPVACGKVDENQSTEFGVQRAVQATTGHDPGLLLPPWAEPARDNQRGCTPGLARSVRSPDPTRDRYQRPKWLKERQDGPWSRVWRGGRGQATNIACKGANRPEACANVQRLSQISEHGVQSTEGTG